LLLLRGNCLALNLPLYILSLVSGHRCGVVAVGDCYTVQVAVVSLAKNAVVLFVLFLLAARLHHLRYGLPPTHPFSLFYYTTVAHLHGYLPAVFTFTGYGLSNGMRCWCDSLLSCLQAVYLRQPAVLPSIPLSYVSITRDLFFRPSPYGTWTVVSLFCRSFFGFGHFYGQDGR
jgi:hypothetical protein